MQFDSSMYYNIIDGTNQFIRQICSENCNVTVITVIVIYILPAATE